MLTPGHPVWGGGRRGLVRVGRVVLTSVWIDCKAETGVEWGGGLIEPKRGLGNEQELRGLQGLATGPI